MVAFGLGDGTNLVRERKRLREVGEPKDAPESIDVVELHELPLGYVRLELRELLVRHGRGVAPARDTVHLGQPVHPAAFPSAPAERSSENQLRVESPSESIIDTCYCMHMLEKRLQILLDEDRWKRLSSYAAERNLSVGAVVREALDRAIPASRDKRRAAARRILAAKPMDVPSPAALRRELDAIRGRRA
jgi:hypothetical protein